MTGRVIVLRGDAAHLPLPDASVDLVVCSPPYWNLRDYRDGGESLAGQIGSEPTWQEYLASLLACTREWVRVLKPEGSLFVNLGDKYANDAKWGGATSGKHVEGLHGRTGIGRAKTSTGIPAKSLIGLPWRYVIACVDELGLVNRRDNIWHKTSGMPESVDDRCATRHEYVFHLARQGRYFAAVDEIREPHVYPDDRRGESSRRTARGATNHHSRSDPHPLGRLPGSVWDIPSLPLNVPEWLEHGRCCGGRKRPGCEDGLDHHAAFPPALARKCILGWSPPGICTACGQGRRPVVHDPSPVGHVGVSVRDVEASAQVTYGTTSQMRLSGGHQQRWKRQHPAVITGYACACPDTTATVRPSLVVDPFGGTGTTALVASVLGRTGVTVDRSADYCDLAAWRTADAGERARALGLPKPPPQADGQMAFDFADGEAAS